MTNDLLVIEPVDVRLAEPALLIARLSEDLGRRYGDDGSGHFRPEDVLVPRSGFLVGRWDGQPVACGGFRPLSEEVAEIKRMYVEPAFRGRGIGRSMLDALETGARQAGFTKVRLETGTAQQEALGLYQSAGYQRIECYGYHKDDPRSVCFEKVLTGV
jgi:GNAT superfamily N-acetyltransferase